MKNLQPPGDLSPQAPLPDGSTHDAHISGVSELDATPSESAANATNIADVPATAAPTAKANKLTYRGIMRDLARQKVEGCKFLRKVAPESASETPDVGNTSANQPLGESQFTFSGAQQRSIQIVNLYCAIMKKVEASEAILSLVELLRYVVTKAGKTFNVCNISLLLNDWCGPRYDAARQILDDAARQILGDEGDESDETTEQMMHLFLSEHLEQLGLALKVAVRHSPNCTSDNGRCTYFDTRLVQNSDDFDSFMLPPMADTRHLLDRQHEKREEVDRLMEKVRETKANLSAPRDSNISDSTGLDTAESVDSNDK